MNSDMLAGSGAAVFLLAAVVYVIGRRLIEKYERRNRTLSDEERLAAMAAETDCSEFDLFRQAGRQWQVAATQIDEDFRRYLTRGRLPFYVRDFIRKNDLGSTDGNRDITRPGGDLPPSWSA